MPQTMHDATRLPAREALLALGAERLMALAARCGLRVLPAYRPPLPPQPLAPDVSVQVLEACAWCAVLRAFGRQVPAQGYILRSAASAIRDAAGDPFAPGALAAECLVAVVQAALERELDEGVERAGSALRLCLDLSVALRGSAAAALHQAALDSIAADYEALAAGEEVAAVLGRPLWFPHECLVPPQWDPTLGRWRQALEAGGYARGWTAYVGLLEGRPVAPEDAERALYATQVLPLPAAPPTVALPVPPAAATADTGAFPPVEAPRSKGFGLSGLGGLVAGKVRALGAALGGLFSGGRQEPESAGAEPPPAAPQLTDLVRFSVAAPPQVAPGESFLLDVWVFVEAQREEMKRRAREAQQGQEIALREKGPVRLARGSALTVRLQIPGMEIGSAEDTLLWQGEIGNASFAVSVPADASPGRRPGCITLHAGGLQVARIDFVVAVAPASAPAQDLPFEVRRYRSAFCSYAREDSAEVGSVVQGMKKIVPDLDVFIDVMTLRAGQHWEQELRQAIDGRDVFYLFWSKPASESHWVEKEWRYAFESHGLDFIDPIPLASPREVPPPQDLGALHFDDWMLAFKRYCGASGRQ